MATSAGNLRLANGGNDSLSDEVFDVLRAAVIVINPRSPQLPLVSANAAARRWFAGSELPVSLVGSAACSYLGSAMQLAVAAAALEMLTTGKSCIERVLSWRFPRGEVVLPTELKMLGLATGRPLIMLTFPEPPQSPEPLPDPAPPEHSLEPGVLSALEQLPLDLLLLKTDLTVSYANSGAARTAGTTPEALLRLPATAVAPTSALPREALAAALEGVNFHHEAIAVRTPDGPTRWFDVDVQPLTSQSEVVGVAVVSLDVTERRRRPEPAGEGANDRLSALTEHARDIIGVAGVDGKLLYVSGGVTHSLGYAPEERLAHSIYDNIHPDDAGALEVQFSELVDGLRHAFSLPLRVRHRDGSYRWLELSFVSALENPLIKGVVVNARDVTDRKQAESRLAQREEVFKLAADALDGVLFEWDLRRGVVQRSRGVRDVLGLDPERLETAGAWSALIHPEDKAAYDEQAALALARGDGWTASYRIRDAWGRYRSVLERVHIQHSAGGEPVKAIGCVVDVSEIKRLSDLLAETQRVAKLGGWEYNYATGELEWTDEMFRLYETSRAEFAVSLGAMLAQCPAESRLRLTEAIGAAESSGGALDVELQILSLKGQLIWVRLVGHIEMLEGRRIRAYGSMQNIQEQKLAQIGLANSTDWLKLSMNMAQLHAWRWNRATDTLEFANLDGSTALDLPRVFPGMSKLLARVHRDDRGELRRAIDHAFEHRTEFRREFRLKSRGGYRVHVALARPLFDAADQPTGLVGLTRDMHAWYESQARLRRSEELLRTTTANSADTLLLVDTNLRIRFINRDAGGMSMEALVGGHIGLLLPEPVRDDVVETLHRVLATGETATYEFDADASTGMESFDNCAVLVRDDGVATGISISMRNITERKRLEKEILDAASRERQAIGRDLHDGLGQELTGVALMLRAVATRIESRCPESKERLAEIARLVNQSIDTARSVARGLMPVDAESGGLPGALHSLAERSRDAYGLKVECKVRVSAESSLSEAAANHVYRIAQEALTNAARHAQASQVRIVLLVTPDKFLLRVTDDGIGIDGTRRSKPGMGLKIMKYRASMMGATFEIEPNHPRGTVIRVAGQQVPATRRFASA